MSLKKILLVALATLVVCGGFALPCQAQNTFRRHRPLRWLGQGFSDGYHRQNPGYDTSYYNPYSAHNSNLISQSPEYLAIRPVSSNQHQSLRFFNGVPFSDYAAPPQLNSHLQTSPSQQFQGSFSPSADSRLESDLDDGLSDDLRSDDEADEDKDFEDFEDFEEDDNDFREQEDDGPADMGDDDLDDDVLGDDDLGDEAMGDGDAGDEVDTSDLGGLSGLNDSLSFDFE